MEFAYLVLLLVCLAAMVINVLLIVWFYELRRNSIKQTQLLTEQNAFLEYQSKVGNAQLHLLASMATAAGVPAKDVNDAVLQFGIKYE